MRNTFTNDLKSSLTSCKRTKYWGRKIYSPGKLKALERVSFVFS